MNTLMRFTASGLLWILATATALSAQAADTLQLGGQMTSGTSLQSLNAKYRFMLQNDGNMVLSRQPGGTVHWSAVTGGLGGVRLVLQNDGNLVLRTSAGTAVWASNTAGKSVARLQMQDNGFLALINQSGVSVWSKGSGEQTTIDASTLDFKVMAGYQGWFMTDSDGSGAGWRHWAPPGTMPNATTVTVDLWPDMREYGANELTATEFKYRDGKVAGLYSAWNSTTVDRHVKWMRDYGIDGVFVQRFIGEAIHMQSVRDRVLSNVMAGSERYGRVFANMYDISGGTDATLINDIKTDWMHLVDDERITQSHRYIKHKGKPVVAIWGFGVDGRPGSASQLKSLLRWFNTDAAERYRATVVLGVDDEWRTHSAAWIDAYDDAAVISPWTVGRYNSENSADNFRVSNIDPDISALQGKGVAYMPVIWPGFSWYNLKDGAKPLNHIPRNGGRFFWRQAYNATAAGADMIYVAMYDEVDEGTAMFKVAENTNQLPSTGKFVTLDADGEALPSDHYLNLMGEASRMLRGERALSPTMP